MAALLLLCFLLCLPLRAQEWPYFGGDSGGAKYSTLKQINRRNVGGLRVAWTYHTGDVSDGTAWVVRSAFEGTPLIVDGVMYLTTPFCRLIALEAENGRELWAFDPKLDKERPHNLFINRGAAYWTDGKRKRLYYGTLEGNLHAIDALTGRPVETFGRAGKLDLREGVSDIATNPRYSMTSPPSIYKDLVICGSLTSDAEPRGVSGDVRAFDVHTGKMVWRFHVTPHEGEFGFDTWQPGSAPGRQASNAWAPLSVDVERGLVFLPLTSAATNYYGGDRKGANLFSNALVAVDAATGKRVWHYQISRHDLWDYDLPAQPSLVTVKRAGKLIPAVAQVTKQGFAFVFDRITGKPLFDIEERAMPPSDLEGEEASPRQPIPIKPPPYARQGMRRDELTDVTPESRAFCGKQLEGATIGTLYMPLSSKPTILFPGNNGGANYGGASFDPETRTLYVNSQDVGFYVRMVKRPGDALVPYRMQSLGPKYAWFMDDKGYPCQKPPWGHLTAIDLDTGQFRWRAVLGVVDELLAKGVPPTGSPNIGGSIVTAGGLVFIGATNDSRFRAFDKDSGKELWVTRLPASAHAAPATYLGKKTGKQFVVIAAGGGNKYNDVFSDSLIAYTLP